MRDLKTSWLECLPRPLSAEMAAEARGAGADPAEMLVQRGLATADEILDAMSAAWRLPVLSLGYYEPQREAVALVAQDAARRFGVLPLFVLDDRLYLAMTDPVDLAAQDFLQQVTGMGIEPVVALRADLDAAINRIYLSTEQASRAIGAIAGTQARQAVDEMADLFEDREAPAIRLVEHIIGQAIHLAASDIHLEPYAKRVQLRYRVDGILHEFPPPPMATYPAVVSRIKIACKLDIAEKRLPQDGRMSIRVEDRDYDLRVAVIPNLHGEGVVIRVLNSSAMDRGLGDLGFEPDMLARYETLIRRPHGITLVTGPTGSGKTTTLYATIKHIFTVERKFVTLEDPVELQMDGVTQIQVRPDIGFHFADGLRSVLRYDPDVVMVGEIRDLESAEISIRASLTGHLLFSTLHTNSAVLAVTRLMDMGLEPFMVLTSLNGVLAQRLLRRLCPSCSIEGVLEAAEMASLRLEGPPRTVRRPQGCPDCGGLGYRGRVAVYELLEITPQMRRLAGDQLSAERIRELAGDQLRTLRESAIAKLLAGVTSVGEVLALTAEE